MLSGGYRPDTTLFAHALEILGTCLPKQSAFPLVAKSIQVKIRRVDVILSRGFLNEAEIKNLAWRDFLATTQTLLSKLDRAFHPGFIG